MPFLIDQLGSSPVPLLEVVPDFLTSFHLNALGNGTILLLFLVQELLDGSCEKTQIRVLMCSDGIQTQAIQAPRLGCLPDFPATVHGEEQVNHTHHNGRE